MRVAESVAMRVAGIALLLEEGRPAWASAETWRAARELVKLARRDLVARYKLDQPRAFGEASPTEAAAEELGVSPATWRRWRADGWLSGDLVAGARRG